MEIKYIFLLDTTYMCVKN